MILEKKYDQKKKQVKLIVRDSSGYPIYYERIMTIDELKDMVETLSD